MHLGGSLSEDFALLRAKELGLELKDFRAMTIQEKFSLAHTVINNKSALIRAALDVAEHNPANYLEIRSTPRTLEDSSDLNSYAKAFSQGLKEAQAKTGKKIFGLLSVDRYKNNLEEALEIFELAKNSEMIVGIDISGFSYSQPRKLKARDLATFVMAVLKKSSLGLGVHVGEFNTKEEKIDTSATLESILAWNPEKKGTWGRVRLGHVIYLTEEQKHLIRQMEIPVEICPTCHESVITCQKSGPWYKKAHPHPVLSVYEKKQKTPVVYGSDDSFVFHVDFERDQKIFKEAVGEVLDWHLFRFSP